MAQRNPTAGCGEQGICNEVALDCDPCCRCIPVELCATIRDIYDNVLASSLLSRSGTIYFGQISCHGESASVEVSLIRDAYGVCGWQLTIFRDQYHILAEQFLPITTGVCERPRFELPAPFVYCGGILTIERRETGVLPLSSDETGCPRPYCGNCHCVCKTLCVTIVDSFDHAKLYEELDWNPNSFQWGSGYDSFTLIRDPYTGECLLGGTINGEVLDFIPISDCRSISGSWFLYNGTLVSVTCKECYCAKDPCCFPGTQTELTLYITGISTGWGPGEYPGVRYPINTVPLRRSEHWFMNQYFPETGTYYPYRLIGPGNEAACVVVQFSTWWGGSGGVSLPPGVGINKWDCATQTAFVKPSILNPPMDGWNGYYVDIEVTII